MSISADEVRRIAALAALELRDDEVDRLAGELSDILGHFELLRSAEDAEGAERAEGFTAEGAEGAEGAKGTTDGAPLRPDEPAADRLEADPGAMAPGWKGGFFTVRRLASHGTATADPAGSDQPDESGEPSSGESGESGEGPG